MDEEGEEGESNVTGDTVRTSLLGVESTRSLELQTIALDEDYSKRHVDADQLQAENVGDVAIQNSKGNRVFHFLRLQFHRFHVWLDKQVEKLFYKLGLFCADHPKIVIGISVLIVLLCSIGIIFIHEEHIEVCNSFFLFKYILH